MGDCTPTVWTDETRRAYAAGIMEAEGYIQIKKSGRGFSLYLATYQNETRFAILELMRDVFGAKWSSSIEGKGNRKPFRHAFWTGRPAYDFLCLIRPYFLVKAEQAAIAIEYYEKYLKAKEANSFSLWLTPFRQEAAALYEKLSNLTFKGKVRQPSSPVKRRRKRKPSQ